jgi:hypothetical protein
MSRLLFENSNFAVGFAGVTLGAAALFASLGSNFFMPNAGDDEASEAAEESAPAEPSPAATFEDQPESGDWAAEDSVADDAAWFSTAQQDGDDDAESSDRDEDGGAEPDADNGGFASVTPAAGARSKKPRRTSVTVTDAEGVSGPVEVGLAPGKGENVSFSENLKLTFE